MEKTTGWERETWSPTKATWGLEHSHLNNKTGSGRRKGNLKKTSSSPWHHPWAQSWGERKSVCYMCVPGRREKIKLTETKIIQEQVVSRPPVARRAAAYLRKGSQNQPPLVTSSPPIQLCHWTALSTLFKGRLPGQSWWHQSMEHGQSGVEAAKRGCNCNAAKISFHILKAVNPFILQWGPFSSE